MNRIERETERDYRSIPLSLPPPPPSPPPSACTRLCASWRYAGPRADRNPTDVQHVYVSQATLTLQFMRALTGPQPFHLFGPRPPSSPPAGPLNTTANLPTWFDVQVHSPQEGRSLSLSLSSPRFRLLPHLPPCTCSSKVDRFRRPAGIYTYFRRRSLLIVSGPRGITILTAY